MHTDINKSEINQSTIDQLETTQPREQEAIDVYSKWLEKKGISADSLSRRLQYINALTPYLKHRECSGSVFRDAVDMVLCQNPADDWPYVLAVVREYFNFWLKDFKAIASLNSENNIDFEALMSKPVERNLKTLWGKIDEEKFTMVELWPIKAYTMALRQEGGEKSLVDTRVKLAKLLLLRLREYTEINHVHYRLAVDSLLPLFKARQTRVLYLAIVREFYYFWIGDPEAVSYIQIDKLDIAI